MDLLPKNAIELAQTLGIAVMVLFSLIIFAGVMVLYMRAESRRWEDREKRTSEIYQSIVDQVNKAREEDMKLLKRALDTTDEQININRGLLERQSKSETALRDIFEKLSKILEDRCRNHFQFNQKHHQQRP